MALAADEQSEPPPKKKQRLTANSSETSNPNNKNEQGNLGLSEELLDYCTKNGIDANVYLVANSLPRYVRINLEKVCINSPSDTDPSQTNSNSTTSITSTDSQPHPIQSHTSNCNNSDSKQNDLVSLSDLKRMLSNELHSQINCNSANAPDAVTSSNNANNSNSAKNALVRHTALPDFLQLPGHVTINTLNCFKKSLIFGMDLASGICVKILFDSISHSSNYNILDLCCAPGNKLFYMSQILSSLATSKINTPNDSKHNSMNCSSSRTSGTNNNIDNIDKNAQKRVKNTQITGVDISSHRLNIVKKQVRKQRLSNIRLYCQDGTSFDTKPTRNANNPYEVDITCLNKKQAKHRRKRVRKMNANIAKKAQNVCEQNAQVSEEKNEFDDIADSFEYYDRVLVDAQCTHDGSIRHVVKYVIGGVAGVDTNESKHANNAQEKHAQEPKGQKEQFGFENFNKYVLDAENIEETVELQKKLILNGIRLVSPENGVLVYATCSLNVAQNEKVVEYLFEMEGQCCKLVDLSGDEVNVLKGFKFKKGVDVGSKKCDTRMCIRFDPVTSNTSGLFVAKIIKHSRAKCEASVY